MKPKTKIQIKVVELSSKLNSISDKHKEWAFEKCHEKFAVRSRKTLYCLECGHSWKDESVLLTSILGCTCPNCKCDLKVRSSYERVCRDMAYFAVLTTIEDMQVVRMFAAIKYMKKGQKAEPFVSEVMQHWIDVSGNVMTMSKSVQGLSRYYDQWIFHSEMEVRPKSYQSCPRYDIKPYKIYPERKILSTIKRNGFKGNFYEFAPHQLFSLILQNSYAETLLKTGQIELLKYRYSDIIIENWPTIKVCIRNDYKIKDASMWFDYLKLLKHFGKDIYNPKYVCPENLKSAHDHFMKKKREQDRKLHLIELRERIDADQKEYEIQKGKFLGILFGDGEIVIKSLDTIEEFLNEGDALEHCVFTNEYYKKANSLILSARIDNNPIETIEVSLENLSVVQARGISNQPTKYHDRIVNLVKDNIRQQIAQCA